MLVVDAYNALHVTGVLPPEIAGPELADLVALVAASRWGRDDVVLVCDGTVPRKRSDELGAKEGRPGRGAGFGAREATDADHSRRAIRAAADTSNIRIEYAGAGKSADGHIAKLVQECSHPTKLTVVSNDRQVQASARKRRARVLAADEWLAQLAADYKSGRGGHARPGASGREPRGPISSSQADEWLRYFEAGP